MSIEKMKKRVVPTIKKIDLNRKIRLLFSSSKLVIFMAIVTLFSLIFLWESPFIFPNQSTIKNDIGTTLKLKNQDITVLYATKTKAANDLKIIVKIQDSNAMDKEYQSVIVNMDDGKKREAPLVLLYGNYFLIQTKLKSNWKQAALAIGTVNKPKENSNNMEVDYFFSSSKLRNVGHLSIKDYRLIATNLEKEAVVKKIGVVKNQIKKNEKEIEKIDRKINLNLTDSLYQTDKQKEETTEINQRLNTQIDSYQKKNEEKKTLIAEMKIQVLKVSEHRKKLEKD
ncbi:hypothetical protein [Enterococcus phoeniculicola]|uniref:Uncharacterized protein n=1 Tax=Enterococcus phoeniculicola ATCC BAA-412 TaxID=1158610 RepID=R3TND5_9ENTE|nr:hypothetical protein [Enterococcus phoeniculicola]EOL43004.1 hypothetical protein UC3_01981 [Enterococcus phoeniculicola ATCC BAA-412]EOT76638.1 hypothetical protein I589_01595 [Enterococcus phoeniculicola ATCC BAA-412]